MRYRIEKDSLGEKVIPQEAYYGIQTIRSKEAFQITKHGQCRQNIKAFAQIKKCFALTNGEFGFISKEKSEAISLSCDEILNGRLHGQFITDQIQDGYGFGMNDNANEVIANRANEMLGGEKGKFDKVSIEDVNMNQNIDEVVLLAGKITTLRLVKKLIVEGKKLSNAYLEKLESSNISNNDIAYLEITSLINILNKDIKRLDKANDSLLEINLGQDLQLEGSQLDDFLKKALKNLSQSSSEKFVYAKNIFDSSRNLDCFMHVSTTLKNLIANFSKCMADFKKLVEDGKISIPLIQEIKDYNGKTIIFDMIRQISFYIMGNDLTVSRSVEEGVLEVNIYKPMIYACLFESSNLIRRTIRTIREKVIEPMEILAK